LISRGYSVVDVTRDSTRLFMCSRRGSWNVNGKYKGYPEKFGLKIIFRQGNYIKVRAPEVGLLLGG